ncbi:hypothetical protein RIR_jg28257.t1 [Rhizophagus irregularis DAOM 181602=DAOM 197198]|nr:hypothetical protein RIR_jg28257.t1 [Rhizophagus irregularis DAOM 181602=DAOM 197198]
MTTDNASNMNVFGQHFTQMLSNNHGNILSRHTNYSLFRHLLHYLNQFIFIKQQIFLQRQIILPTFRDLCTIFLVDSKYSTCQHDAIQVFQVNKCLGVAKFTINPTGNRLNPESKVRTSLCL